MNPMIVILLLWSPLSIAELETVPESEPESIEKIWLGTSDFMNKLYQKGSGKTVLRDAHAKAHACVRAKFTIRDDISTEFREGVFRTPGKQYSAWVRFSSSATVPAADAKRDGRGMAIKLMSVVGKKVLEDETNESTQDFVMINYPVFLVRNAEDYVAYVDAQDKGSLLKFFIPDHNPFHVRWQELRDALGLKYEERVHLLAMQYYSMTPYLLGKDRAIKFSARSCNTDIPFDLNEDNPDFLRKQMKEYLSANDACFDFLVQERKEGMPIEDPTVLWDFAEAPLVPIARIEIKKQVFDTEVQNTFCENLSFTPWHALPEHRPLGGINRVRKVIYEKISKFRHGRNGAVRREPTENGFYSQH
ncbi:MAG: catalase family protein [Dehalococcoidia bacterium]|nr:catalase family protein [Dehalococcoidia bacterium]